MKKLFIHCEKLFSQWLNNLQILFLKYPHLVVICGTIVCVGKKSFLRIRYQIKHKSNIRNICVNSGDIESNL